MPDFVPETSSTLVVAQIDVDKGKRSFASNHEKVADDKRKWNFAIVRLVTGNNASYLT